ncbi:hypothetical protein SAMN05216360_102388 [Methylobacterium phyllostachyos]|uniref:Uncharacterized protein n=1 Tax=Methylobacterium phyllostachyos TaxID=582672 RepID=A0A1G9U410_9HYPH|nr:hypothetical protein [Methylobacterium phyllostachyos]SDM54295.1 hypothetical protein SAMN05216360_102388 [Methylobacterium phyllostachyos]
MSEPTILFSKPIATVSLPGFPDVLADVAAARRAVEAARLPVARSCPAWVEASNRLLLAQATRTVAAAEAARIALVLAAAGESLNAVTAFAVAA